MKKTGKLPGPPSFALRFLRWYCRPDRLEEIEGDLEEFFHYRVSSGNTRHARLRFWLDVLRCFKPYAWRKGLFDPLPETRNFMLRNYFKTSVRNLLKNKAFAVINITGLALSMSVCLLIILLVKDQFSVDLHNPNYDQVYRIVTQTGEKGKGNRFATSPVPIGTRLAEEHTQVQLLAQFAQGMKVDALANQREFFINGIFASPHFFNVMGFKLKSGNVATALAEPYSVVLTAETARKFFGDTDPLGQPIALKKLAQAKEGGNQRRQCTVTGVLPDDAPKTHLRFEAILSFATLPLIDDVPDLQKLPEDWQNFYVGYNYLLLKKHAGPAELENAMATIAKARYAGTEQEDLKFSLQPLAQIAPARENIINQAGVSLPVMVVFFLAALAAVVLLSATINYTNLSIARSLSRMREVGIRKVSGATRGQVAAQFLVESVVVALLALALAICMLQYLVQAFYSLDQEFTRLFDLQQDLYSFLFFGLFALVAGLLAGLFPAIAMSRFTPVQVLKGTLATPARRRFSGKKALALLQFSFSIIFVVSSFIIYHQFRHVMSGDLGLNTENVVCIPLKGNQFERVEQAYRSLAVVEEVAASSILPNTHVLQNIYLQLPGKSDSLQMNCFNIVPSYLDVMDIELVAGSNFTGMAANQESQSQVLLNEKAVQALGMGSPAEAIGATLLKKGKALQVAGVVKNFRYNGMQSPVGPFVFTSNRKELNHISLKVAPSDHQQLVQLLQDTWYTFDEVHLFQYKFYKEEVREAEILFLMLVKVIGFTGFLSVVIACLGLLGMAIFNTKTRQKEIGVRKVLGASVWQVVLLLSKGFLMLMGISVLIALPLVYIGNNIWLEEFAYRIDLGPEILLPGVLLILVAGLLTIGTQTFKAARLNPADSLRSE